MVRTFLPAMVAGLLVMSGCGCEKAKDVDAAQEQKSVSEETAPATSVIVAITNNEDFEKNVEKATKPVVVKFFANWCGACKDVAEAFEQLAKQMPEKVFCSVNIDEVKELTQKFNINGVPTIMFFKDGKEVDSSKRHIGAASKEYLEKAVNEAFGVEAAPADEASKAEEPEAEQPEAK